MKTPRTKAGNELLRAYGYVGFDAAAALIRKVEMEAYLRGRADEKRTPIPFQQEEKAS